ncbi:hypothetical protein ABE501_20705 [Comamonas testosteroni]
MSILIDLILGIFEFIGDVLLFRYLREKEGSRRRSATDDAFVIAHFEFVAMVRIGLVSVGLMFLLIFGLDIPVAWGVGIGLGVGVVWGYRKYVQLTREA